MQTHLAATVLALALLGGAAGCGDDPVDEPGPVAADPTASDVAPPEATPSETGTAAPEPLPSTPPFQADTEPDDGGHGEGGLRWVTDVRVARHDGFDRIVFDLDGPGKPGWYVSYTDDPRQDGSGDPVAVEGDAYLQVVLRGMGYPGFDGIPEIDLGTMSGAGTGAVTEIVTASVFEGDHLLFIGLAGDQRPFRAFALSDPTRVVVDVRHE
jgi:hypothetical protein